MTFAPGTRVRLITKSAEVSDVEYGDVFVTFPGEPYDGWYAQHFELAE